MRSRIAVVFSLTSLWAVVAVTGCNQKPANQPGAPMGSQVVAQIGTGTLNGRTYTHDHFKMSVTIPDEWYIQNKTESDHLAEVGSTVMKEETKAAMQAAQQRTLTLLSAFRHAPGTPVPFNQSMMVLAENVAFLPGLKKGEDYLKVAQQTMANLTIKYEFDKIENGLKIGSLDADRLTAHTKMGGSTVNQEYYAARSGEYFIVVILTYATDEERDGLREILKAMKAG